ncbi:uroporphyrinogen decarboxylase [Methylobacter sp.]|uniref:uroporphyrinogen decarboxylase n=1 Tax=Methylobacter sp. TaxID=2051955 RepID=UPI002489188F|nr:uroporphyrinogen decarboxylase [Methylobacter sp.]MDI1277174.1 uroporphyrinogen decarboxylase [Methylobacter sp.]MDI1358675.1 uroporphyrinogen decarboxylase [Methylobacter sp.]
MTALKNDTFIRALLKQPVDYTPIWMMRQAGRYLPEYRKVREQAGSFLDLCTNPELACEVTLQPLRRFDFDAAILFSDILTIPDAMGLGLYFTEGEGPKFTNPVRTAADVNKLPIPDPETDLRYVVDAVRLIRKNLQGSVPLIGFSGSPWTLATYMVEGGSSKSFQKVKSMMYEQPKLMHVMLDKLAQSVAAYLNAQIEAGAQAVMLFDTWGGMLTTEDYVEFSLYYAKQVRALLKTTVDGQQIPTILFTKGGGLWLEAMADSGYDALGLDWQTDMQQARARVGHQVALQGNMDPVALYASPEVITEKVKTILHKYGSGSGHVFNLGHGILPDMNPDHVKAMVDAVHEHSRVYHQA